MTSARELDDGQATMRAEGSAATAGAGDAADAGINDVMFDLGGDERRMHVRAYNHWVSLLKGRPYPTIADLDPGSIADFGPHSVLMDFRTPNGADPQRGGMPITDPGIAFLGTALREECGLVGRIDSIADVPSRSLLSRLTDHYLQIIANRAPVGFEAEFVNSRGRTTLYRGILMPFASNDEGIDFLYGVINWKELADAGLQATLAAELDAAVRAMPPRSHAGLAAYAMTAPDMPGLGGISGGISGGTQGGASVGHAHATSPGVPIWADGPSAQFDSPPPSAPPSADIAPSPTHASASASAVLAHVAIDGEALPAGVRTGDVVLLVARVAQGGGYDIVGTITDDQPLITRALEAIDR